MSHGGKREGSGRKAMSASLQRKNILIGLPPELVEWMDAQPKSRAALIEDALQSLRGMLKTTPEAACVVTASRVADEIAFDHPALAHRV